MTTAKVKTAKVAVLLSTFNGGRFLQQQLNSLHEQTYPEIMILVRDDGSSDSTRSILDREQAKGRLDVLEGNKNLGPALSFFELLRSAAALTTTEYIAFCDQDDVWHPEKIEHAVSTLTGVTGSCPAMYCSRLEIVDEHLKHVGFTEMPEKFGFGNALVENVAVGCTIVLNRKAIDLICENLPSKIYIHDWWCYLVLSCFGEIIFDDKASIKYRQHGSNAIGLATNRLDRLGRNLSRFFGRGRGHLWVSEQASAFSIIFNERIPSSQRQVLNKFNAAKSTFRCRVQMAFSREIWRQKWSDNLILRFLLLINRI